MITRCVTLSSMPFGALGDIHGDFAAARRIMERHREVPFWLCIGDVADDEGRYEEGRWVPGRRMNGDQTHQGRHVSLGGGDFSMQRVKLYRYR